MNVKWIFASRVLFVFTVFVCGQASTDAPTIAVTIESASQVAETEDITIEIGTFSAPTASVAWLDREVDAFTREHPHIKVKRIAFSEPERWQYPLHKDPLLAANVIGIDSAMGYEVPFLVEKGSIVPIDKFLPDAGFDYADFYDNYWDAVRYDESIWGVPWLALADLLVCDEKIFEAAGLKGPPSSWDELVDFAGRLTQDFDGDGTVDQWGLRLNSSDDTIPNLLMSVIFQKGGRLMRSGKISLSDPAIQEGLQAIHEIAIKSGHANLDSRSMEDVLADTQARYGMHIVPGDQLQRTLRNNNLRLAPIPSAGLPITVAPRRLYFGIRKSTPEKEQASWEFVKWMSRTGCSMPDVLTGYPCRKDFIEREDFKALASSGIRDMHVLYTTTATGVDCGDQAINRLEAFEVLYKSLVPVLMGQATLDSVAEATEVRVNALLLGVVPGNDVPRTLFKE